MSFARKRVKCLRKNHFFQFKSHRYGVFSEQLKLSRAAICSTITRLIVPSDNAKSYDETFKIESTSYFTSKVIITNEKKLRGSMNQLRSHKKHLLHIITIHANDKTSSTSQLATCINHSFVRHLQQKANHHHPKLENHAQSSTSSNRYCTTAASRRLTHISEMKKQFTFTLDPCFPRSVPEA